MFITICDMTDILRDENGLYFVMLLLCFVVRAKAFGGLTIAKSSGYSQATTAHTNPPSTSTITRILLKLTGSNI